jgi:hypothetical protein
MYCIEPSLPALLERHQGPDDSGSGDDIESAPALNVLFVVSIAAIVAAVLLSF